MSRIEGKVASVLNERELVLNVGSDDGVTVGMRFRILYPGGIAITDPDTDEPLGSVEWPKTEVKIVSVQPKISVGRTFRKFVTPASGTRGMAAYAALNLMGNYTPERVETETLRSGSPFAEKELDPSESFVNRGDPAVEVVPERKQAEIEEDADVEDAEIVEDDGK